MKLHSMILLLFVTVVFTISITGCSYHEHYNGSEEKIVDEGVVVRERYIVE